MTTNEVWKTVEIRPAYEVSNLGRVRNKSTGEIKATRPTKTGYRITDLKGGGHKRTSYIHRLVAEAFVPNPKHLPYVNHKDEDKSNNAASNLEWCTPAYNNAYGTHCERISRTKTEKYGLRLRQIDKQTGETVRTYNSGCEAAKAMKITPQAIQWALKAKHHTAAGYRWEVIE